jgi:SAM-dependent methyltransferase
LAHGYHTLQHWNGWLEDQPLGNSLMQAEQHALSGLLKNHYGKHALLIGVPQQYQLMDATVLPRHTLVSPLIDRQHAEHYIESTLHELPLLTGTLDLVILPHTLELVDHPRHLLAEACRVIKPEGLIVICGFNPYSLWGLRKWFAKHKHHNMPWSNHFTHAQKIKGWLRLADFAIEKQSTHLFRPPLNNPGYFEKLKFMESIGSTCFPALGGIYVVLARAKVIPLTPIKMKWKQPFGAIRLPTSMPGPIIRSSK